MSIRGVPNSSLLWTGSSMCDFYKDKIKIAVPNFPGVQEYLCTHTVTNENILATNREQNLLKKQNINLYFK